MYSVSCLPTHLFFFSPSISISYSPLKLASYVSRLIKGQVSFTSSFMILFPNMPCVTSCRHPLDLFSFSFDHLSCFYCIPFFRVLNWTSVACQATPPASHIVATWYESVFSLIGLYSFWTLSYGGFYYLKENHLLNLIWARHLYCYSISDSSGRWLLWPSCGQSCSKGTSKKRNFKVEQEGPWGIDLSLCCPLGHLLILYFVALNMGWKIGCVEMYVMV